MFIGMMECDLLLGNVHSLKEKRAIVRPLLAHLRRLDVSVSEVGDADLHRRAVVGVAVVSGQPSVAARVLEECERIVAGNVESDLLAVRRRIVDIDDVSASTTE